LAVLLPFLALMFFVAVDFCRAFHATQVVESCVQCCALYASGAARADPDATTPADAAKRAAVAEGASLSPPLQTEDVSVAVGAESATVTVSYRFPMVTNYLGTAGPGTITRTVTMALCPKAPGAR